VYAYTGAGVVGAVAAVVSFGHLRSLALGAGESPLAAALLPISVDGLLVSAASVMWLDSTAGRRARLSARVAFGAGCAATVAGNVASARPTVTGWLVAAWAPLALLLVTEMLARRGRQTPEAEGPTLEKHFRPAGPTLDRPIAPGRPVKRRPAGKRSAAEKVAVARLRLGPTATQADVVRTARVSPSSVARHWAATTPPPADYSPAPPPDGHRDRVPVFASTTPEEMS
jgi:hypothetical protein